MWQPCDVKWPCGELKVRFTVQGTVPSAFAVLHGLAGGLGKDDALQLCKLQDLHVVHHHAHIRHHVVGQVAGKNLAIWLGSGAKHFISLS